VPDMISSSGSLAVLDDRSLKQAIRQRIRAERLLRDPIQREMDARALAAVLFELPEIVGAECIAAYASTSSAPGTAPLRQGLRDAGIRVVLPVLLGGGHLDWAVDGPAPTGGRGGAGRSGGLLGLEGIGLAQTVIVPALAVDTLGNRLGQGSGFYDRTMRLIEPWVPVFALVYESELLDAAIEPIPAQPHDVPVDAVVTPHRCLRLPPRARG
jgi:5-formyltetrahydrofolate cyclo-ligase